MRALVLATSVLALAACDSGGVPPPGQEPLRASTPQVASDEVLLRGDGLTVGAESFYFSAGVSEVRSALVSVLGEAESTASNDECGAGPMEFIGFAGGLTVNFQDGALVGWLQSEPSVQISVRADVQIGTPKADAAAADGFAEFADSTLGEEFYIGDKLGGIIENDKVDMLYAGTQCFFR